MRETAKLLLRRRTTPRVERTPEELAELRAVRERFQRDKPTLDQILASTGQAEASTLGEYLRARELLFALGQERERQRLTLTQLAERTGYDPAVLSRLFSGRQVNPTLATVGRIANALGKTVIHTLRALPVCQQANGPTKGEKPARRGKAGSGSGERPRNAARSKGYTSRGHK